MATVTHSLPSLDSPQQSRATLSLPEEILNHYVAMVMRTATPGQHPDDPRRFYCGLERFRGVWAEGDSLKECLDTLEEVLRDWLLLKLVDRDMDIPTVDHIDLTVISRRF